MSYLRALDKEEHSFFGIFKRQSEKSIGAKFRGVQYVDGDEEYAGILSVFDNPIEKNLFNYADQSDIPQYYLPQNIPQSVFPTGMSNLGNTGYMNALLQGLVSGEELEKYIFKILPFSHDKSNPTNDLSTEESESDGEYFRLEDSKIEEHQILRSFIEAFYCLRDGERSDEKIVRFYEHLGENFTYIFEQEDAHELLMIIFNMFNDYAKKKTLYRPRLEYMKLLKEGVKQIKMPEKVEINKENNSSEDLMKSSLTTMSSSVISSNHLNLKEKKKETNLSSLLNSKIRGGLEGLMNPFTGIYSSRFTCLNCKDYTWTKHEIRYVLTVSGKHPTIEDNMASEMTRETIENFKCIKCSIRETLGQIRELRERFADRMSFSKLNTLLDEEKLLAKYLELDAIDEEQFEREFKVFKVHRQNLDYYVELAKPESTIIRDHFLSKAPKILCIHINRLGGMDHYGNLVKNSKFIKFPQILKLNRGFGEQYSHQYELKSVAEHIGGSYGGHYVAMRKMNWNAGKHNDEVELNESKQSHSKAYMELMDDYSESGINFHNPGTWVLANDEYIKFITLQEVLSTKAYMLFYERTT